jgi:hypothetical protein
MACCVDAAAANFPPGHAAFAASDASNLGPTVPLSGPIGRHPSAQRYTGSMRGDGRTSPLMRLATSQCVHTERPRWRTRRSI